MKTFKTHLKEYSYDGGQMGSQTANGVDDSNIGVHNIHDAEVLKRVNAFVGSVADCEYLKPQFDLVKIPMVLI